MLGLVLSESYSGFVLPSSFSSVFSTAMAASSSIAKWCCFEWGFDYNRMLWVKGRTEQEKRGIKKGTVSGVELVVDRQKQEYGGDIAECRKASSKGRGEGDEIHTPASSLGHVWLWRLECGRDQTFFFLWANSKISTLHQPNNMLS